MPLPDLAKTTTMDLYRPFGGALVKENIRIRLMEQHSGGRRPADAAIQLQWTHVVECDYAEDIRDGCTRAPGANDLVYADGDEVRIPDGSGTTFAVVWVTPVNRGTEYAFKRVYLMRDNPNWTGTFMSGEGVAVET